MNSKGIAVAGSLILDIGYEIDNYPQKGNLTWIYDPVYHTGGANNILIDLARLDPKLPLKVSGLIGDDDNGQMILEALRQYSNIDTKNISTRGHTALTYAMTEKEGKERTFFYAPGSSLEYNVNDIDLDHLDADFFLLEYLLLLGTLDEPHPEYGTKGAQVLYEAQKRGMKTVIDMVSEESTRYQQVVRPALKYVDYYISNEVEASGVIGQPISDENGIIETKLWAGMEAIREMGVQEWIVIHSPQCAYGLNCHTGEQVKVMSLKLPKGYIKGTTGAGDAFGAGVIYGAYQGLGLTAAITAGIRCAACSLSSEESNLGVVAFAEMMQEDYFIES